MTIQSVPCFERGKLGRAWTCLAIQTPCVFALCINTTPSKRGEVVTYSTLCHVTTCPRSACPIDLPKEPKGNRCQASLEMSTDGSHQYEKAIGIHRVWRNLCSPDRLPMSFPKCHMPLWPYGSPWVFLISVSLHFSSGLNFGNIADCTKMYLDQEPGSLL